MDDSLPITVSDSDDRLLKGVQNGDETALVALFDKYERLMMVLVISFKLSFFNHAVFISLLPSTDGVRGNHHPFPLTDGFSSECSLSRKGAHYLANNYYALALSEYNRVLSRNGNLMDAYLGRAVARWHLNWGRNATIEDLQRAQRLAPTNAISNAIFRIIQNL